LKNSPSLQRIVASLGAAWAGLIAFGALLDSVANALALVPPLLTYCGSAILVSLVVAQHIYMRHHPVSWMIRGQSKRVAAIVGMLSLLWIPRAVSLLRPSATHTPDFALLVRPTSRSYFATEESTLVLEIEVLLDGHDGRKIADDIKLALAFERIAPNGEYEDLSSDEVLHAFAVNSKDLEVPPVDTNVGGVTHRVPLGCQERGHYRVSFVARSPRLAAAAKGAVRLHVRPSYVQCLAEGARSAQSPVFPLLSDDLVDLRPRTVWEVNEFKILLPEEAERTNPAKATLWFAPDYVGAAGGPGFAVYRDTSSYDEVDDDSKDICDSARYVPYLLKTVKQVKKHLAYVTFVGPVSGPATVPIGSSVYALELVDTQRIRVSNVEKDVCRDVSVRKIREKQDALGYVCEWAIEALHLTATSGYNSGATGRNITDWISVGSYRGTALVSSEQPGGSDFPLIIPIGDKDGRDPKGVLFVEGVTDMHVRECRWQ
jgi:hypothetical protein